MSQENLQNVSNNTEIKQETIDHSKLTSLDPNNYANYHKLENTGNLRF